MEYEVKGKLPKITLPKGIGLILEGGGTRGYYSSGVFEAFIDEGIMFSYIIGVSAGAANVLNYLSGQKLRGRTILEKHVGDKEYLGYRNLIKHGSLFNFDYIFEYVAKNYIYFDQEIFDKVKTNLFVGALNIETGDTIWFLKDELGNNYKAVQASCSVPLVSKVVEYKGHKLLDGGVSCPIAIEKSIEDGNTFHVIILTKNEGYRKKPFKYKKFLSRYYKEYPKLVDVMINRHEVYNKQVELCEKLEKEGKAIIIRPKDKVKVGRASRNIKKLLELHDAGYEDGKEVIDKILEMIKNEKI